MLANISTSIEKLAIDLSWRLRGDSSDSWQMCWDWPSTWYWEWEWSFQWCCICFYSGEKIVVFECPEIKLLDHKTFLVTMWLEHKDYKTKMKESAMINKVLCTRDSNLSLKCLSLCIRLIFSPLRNHSASTCPLSLLKNTHWTQEHLKDRSNSFSFWGSRSLSGGSVLMATLPTPTWHYWL